MDDFNYEQARLQLVEVLHQICVRDRRLRLADIRMLLLFYLDQRNPNKRAIICQILGYSGSGFHKSANKLAEFGYLSRANSRLVPKSLDELKQALKAAESN